MVDLPLWWIAYRQSR